MRVVVRSSLSSLSLAVACAFVIVGAEACSGGSSSSSPSGDATPAPPPAPPATTSSSGDPVVTPPPSPTADAGGDANDAPTGPLSPSSFGSALVLWLDGDKGISTVNCMPNQCVTTWADQSGSGNDATAQTALGQPVYKPNQFHTHAALAFDGTNSSLRLADTASLRLSTGFTIVGVAAENASAHIGEIFGKTAAGNPFTGAALWLNYTPGTGVMGAQIDVNQKVTSTETGLSDGKLRVYAARYDGAVATNNLSVRVDKGAAASATVTLQGALGATGAYGYIGGATGSGQVVNGFIAEVVVVNRPLGDAEYTGLQEYLAAKYGL